MATAARDDGFDHVGRKLRTIEHCALHRRTLRLSCTRCDHVRLFDAVPIWWLFVRRRWDDRLSDAAKRFYCGKCWRLRFTKVTAPIISLSRERPGPVQPPYPPESEWRRLVSRYRS